MSTRRSHWLHPNEGSLYPRRIICLDSEAYTNLNGSIERHGFRLAVASYDRIDRLTLEPVASELRTFATPAELWGWVESKCKRKARTVVFAHNLGYDLRLTQALTILPLQGWRLEAICLDAYRCWARWTNEDRSLLMVDTVSFVHHSLGTVARELGMRKTVLPAPLADAADWEKRCRMDVEILREMVLRLLRWLETNECGNFRMTGAAQASAHFRHRFLGGQKLLVHENVSALTAERAAAWTGRCEVYRHGQIGEPITEWDYSLAYARIARTAVLPTRYRGSTGPLSVPRFQRLAETWSVLAACEIRTAVPVAPTTDGERILWPIGTFQTTLWDCELAEALQAGASVRILRTWLYHRTPLLQEWAAWILERLEGTNQETDPIGRKVLKAWSRSLIGRFGLRYPKWEHEGETAEHDLLYLPFYDPGTGERGTYLRIGTQIIACEGTAESPDSAPAIMSYIMALARVRLWRAMQTLPRGTLLYVDTDSLLVTGAGNEACAALAADPYHEGLRPKRYYKGGTIIAPRRLLLDGEVRVAGLPKSARRTGELAFEAEVWEGPSESIRRGHPSEVAVRRRPYRIDQTDRRREQRPDGATVAIRISQ